MKKIISKQIIITAQGIFEGNLYEINNFDIIYDTKTVTLKKESFIMISSGRFFIFSAACFIKP